MAELTERERWLLGELHSRLNSFALSVAVHGDTMTAPDICSVIKAWLSDPAPASPDGGSTSDGTHAAATSAPSCTTTPAQARGAAAPATPERHGYRLPQDAGAELGAISPSTNSTPPAAPQGEAICKRLREYAAAQDRMAARTNEDITHWHHVGLCETLKKAADTIEALTAERTRADAAGFARGVEAAAKEVVQYRCDPNRNRDCYVQNATAVEIDKAIRSLSPPPQRESDEIAKLREECDAHASKNNERAAWWFKKGLEAAVEVVDRDCLDFTIKELTGRILALAFPAQRESASDPLVEWLRDMRDHLKEGFMVCDRCGFDMPTKDMDVVDDIDAAINHATGAKALARRAPREGK